MLKFSIVLVGSAGVAALCWKSNQLRNQAKQQQENSTFAPAEPAPAHRRYEHDGQQHHGERSHHQDFTDPSFELMPSAVSEDFLEYITKYGKSYPSMEEFQKRAIQFQKTKAQISAFQAQNSPI